MYKKLLIESYIDYLYDPGYQVEKTWRGNNLPVEGDCKPNWIRECMLIPNDLHKINCLRKLRETTAMNPMYQHRIDRFIDAITQTYEPTDEPGMVPELQEGDMSVHKQPESAESSEAEEEFAKKQKKLKWSK